MIYSPVFLILLVLVLYKLLKPVNQNHAAVMVVFVMVGIPVSMINQINQLAVLILLSDADYLTIIKADQLHAHVMFFLDLFKYGGYISQFLGFWLTPLGYLVFKSGFLPKILGILLMLACFGYLIDVVLLVLFSNADLTLSLVAFIGELIFSVWLLIMGVNVEQWEKLALGSA